MRKQWPARSFKSGNSVAIRVPAALGIEPNRDWTLEERDGEIVLSARPLPRETLDVDAFWGKAPGVRPLTREEKDLDERPRALVRSDFRTG